jgi:hypothetical protein
MMIVSLIDIWFVTVLKRYWTMTERLAFLVEKMGKATAGDG